MPSALAAALEGPRLARREPGAVAAWGGLWLLALSVAALSVAQGEKIRPAHHAGYRTLAEITAHFGPFAALIMALFLLVWTTTTVAAFRAVLRPTERAWCFLRLGADEARLAVMTVSAILLVLVLGGAPAVALLAMLSPFMAAAPTMARDIATVGALLTVILDIWLAVRLSLIAVETFDERRFHLSAYWPLTRGRFWYLLAAYAVTTVLFLVALGALGVAGASVAKAVRWIGAPMGADPLRRGAILALAGALAALGACFFVATTVLFCACQARAYATIVRREGST